jgi:hypothetical protein
MAGNKRNQQKQLKKRRRENQIRKARNVKSNVSERELLRAAAKADWFGCYIHDDDPFDLVVVLKSLKSKVVGLTMRVDRACRGVIESNFVRDFDTDKIRQGTFDFRKVSPAYMLKLIQDSTAYSCEIGFEPMPKLAAHLQLFGETNPADCTENFTFGVDGKPTYYVLPFEEEEVVVGVVNVLSKLGAGNFKIVYNQSKTLGGLGEFNVDFDDDSLDDEAEHDVESDGLEDDPDAQPKSLDASGDDFHAAHADSRDEAGHTECESDQDASGTRHASYESANARGSVTSRIDSGEQIGISTPHVLDWTPEVGQPMKLPQSATEESR